jgi:hypothetical protein
VGDKTKGTLDRGRKAIVQTSKAAAGAVLGGGGGGGGGAGAWAKPQ